MNTSSSEAEPQGGGLNLSGIFFLLFKHKWKIIFGTFAGLLAAGAVYVLHTSTYESDAKVLVRYVVDTSSVDDGRFHPAEELTDSVISTEVEILTSRDLAMQVAQAVGADRVLPGSKGKATVADAATMIGRILKVSAAKGSKVIFVSYEHPDPEIATLVLQTLIDRYLEMHLEVHRSSGAFEYLTQQSDQMRLRLAQTEDQLKQVKAKAGVVSLDESATALSARMARGQEQLASAEAELAAQRALLQDMQKALSGSGSEKEQGGAIPQASNEDLQRYRLLVLHLEELRKTQMDLVSKYTPENRQVKLNQAQIEDLERQRRDLVQRLPSLAASAPAPLSGLVQTPQADFILEKGRLAALVAKTETLKQQLQETAQMVERFSDGATQIAQLERRKQLEEENAKYFEVSLEKARIDETLNPAKMPNINIVQKPSLALRVTGKMKKIVLGVASSGALLALGLIALVELVLNPKVNRPEDLEIRLGIARPLSIPFIRGRGKGRSTRRSLSGPAKAPASIGQASLAPWEEGQFIRPYAEAIRDRMELYFQVITHKPKLLAVVGLSEGAGTSTLAAGLAAALSKTAEGRVLFVDMNVHGGEMHPFLWGRPALPLSSAIEIDTPIEAAAENLYLATGNSADPDAAQPVVRRFHDLIPRLKNSDFDYIVFDLPPLGQTSPTLAIAGYMDRTILVVEAEKDSPDAVKRAYGELTAVRAGISVIVNKTRSYVPAWLAA